MLENLFLNPFPISKILSPTLMEKIIPDNILRNTQESTMELLIIGKSFLGGFHALTCPAKKLVYLLILTFTLLGNVENQNLHVLLFKGQLFDLLLGFSLRKF